MGRRIKRKCLCAKIIRESLRHGEDCAMTNSCFDRLNRIKDLGKKDKLKRQAKHSKVLIIPVRKCFFF
jgi:hypothetical protein